MSLVFEWDAQKARANQRKHGVSFDEASSVFDDPLAKIFADDEHSDGEQREIIVGHSIVDRLQYNPINQCATGDKAGTEGL